MDTFERMMLQEGVRPLNDRTKPQAKAAAPKAQETKPQVSPERQNDKEVGTFWTNGPAAKKTLEAAIQMAKEDRENRSSTWITGIRQDGRSHTIRPEATFSEIIGQADREDLRLIILGGKKWTCIMHPAMGIATIEGDVE